ncbi:MAG: hypothetical protein IPL96_09930 [Holophagaceae bacterium]|nr:hypothetical protein [Holophagaceae bacterium]
MRLGAGFLTGVVLVAAALTAPAQSPGTSRDKRLPWESTLALPPWQSLEDGPPGIAPPLPAPAEGRDLRVSLARDGSLRVLNRRGVLRLKLGLPGWVLRLWRDGGLEMDPLAPVGAFPADTPLSRGVGELPWGESDLRPGLRGLLWILDDGERVLTLVHPATGRVQYLALPLVSDPELVFWPDHLELRERASAEAPRKVSRRWSLSWPGLLPQFLRLAQPATEGPHGTAFQPFPKD